MSLRFCRVAVDSPVLALDRPFDYVVPDRLVGRVAVGSVVRVPLHGRRVRGFVTEMLDHPAVPDPRPVSALVSSEPLFGPHELDLARWIADRYVTSMGVVLHDAVPGRYSAPAAISSRRPPDRTERPAWLRSPLPVGPGSTTVVLPPTTHDEVELIAHTVGEAGRALVICPRVSVAERIASAIEGAVLVHGDQRPAERAAAWAGARAGSVHVIVGGRAALLAPLEGARLVVLASAHDRSLRSERSPRLHALVVARRRAEMSGAAFLASSPAPPLELVADERVRTVAAEVRGPVRAEVARPRGGPATPRLVDVVRSALGRGTDAFVFVGRVGGVLRLRCVDCGWYPTCPACGAGLGTEEAKGDGRLRCRMCSESSVAPDVCAACGGELAPRGWGHSRVASALERPGLGAPVLRYVRGEVPDVPSGPAVVVGTLAAAHGWPRPFGAVCVADLDQALARPDFRASEHALQILHELAAVLGPGGRFLVQTREPEHHVVQAFTRRSFRYFAQRELPRRREAGYPPYAEIVVVEADEPALHALAPGLRAHGAIVVGPVESRRGAARVLVRTPSVEPLLEALRRFALDHPKARVEVDPVDVI